MLPVSISTWQIPPGFCSLLLSSHMPFCACACPHVFQVLRLQGRGCSVQPSPLELPQIEKDAAETDLPVPHQHPPGSLRWDVSALTAFWTRNSGSVHYTGDVFASQAPSFPWDLCQGTSSSCTVHCQIIRVFDPSSAFPVSSIDSQYWIYDGERRVSGPTPVVELGLPPSPVQAALVWGAEKNKIYIFSGGNYWRFNPHRRHVDNIYPRAMADWRGVPPEIDAAFQDEFGQCSRSVACSGSQQCPAARAGQV